MPGRLERMVDQPLVLLDGAHNAAGIDALGRTVDELLKMRRLHIVMGMVQDKEYELCVRRMARRADAFYACAPAADGREVDAQTVADIAARDCAAVQACASVGDALDRAVGAAAPQDCVLVCGSLYLIGEVEKILRPRQKTAE